ncbi:MAG: hydrolase, partial [Gammaproteobacteria bacterium]
FASGCQPAPTGLAIENVTVIDPVAGTLPGQRVVVRNGLIVSVSAQGEAEEPVAETVDGQDQFLIPGLWDMHVHFLYEKALTDVMAPLFLDYGITSVRDTGGDLAEMQRITAVMAADPTAEPNVYYSGPLLDGRFVVYDGGDPGRPKLGTGIPDAEAARTYVAELKAAGASLIKIYELVSPEVFEVLAAEARAAGLPIASHVPLMMTADRAGPLADSMEHLRNLELACAANWEQLLAERQRIMTEFVEGRGYDLRRSLHSLQRIPAIEAYDEARCDQVLGTLTETIQVPTLRLNTVAIELPHSDPDWPRALAELPPTVADEWQARARDMTQNAPLADPTFTRWSQFLISRLKANGVPIGAGTDTPIGLGIPGWSLHTELAQLVDAGLTPQEALYAATVQAARFLNLEEKVGQVAPGMRADLVLLKANPLEDIGNTRKISRVMLSGSWVR